MAQSLPEPLVVEKLTDKHVLSEFDCGKPPLNDWLKRFALQNQRMDSSRTYIVHRSSVAVGYYSLTAGSIEKQRAPTRIGKGMPDYPIGVIVIVRLATDHRAHGTGLGAALMKDALTRCASAADIIGARAVFVHAIDAEARSFYEHFNFERCPENVMHLILLMKDLRANLRQQ